MSLDRSPTSEMVEARRAAARKTIVATTMGLIEDRPFSQITVEEVMAAAGLSRTAFYRYYPDLDEVLLDAATTISSELQAVAAPLFAPDSWSKEQMIATARQFAETFERHGRLIKGFVDAAASPGSRLYPVYRSLMDWYAAEVTASLVKTIELGCNEIDHVDQVARAVVWMTERYLLESYGAGPSVPAAVAGETLAAIWIRVMIKA